jgi:predicted nucleic acid-binding protein
MADSVRNRVCGQVREREGIPHSQAEKIARRLADVRMVAPALLWFELASACVKKTKAHPEMRGKIAEAFGLGLNLPIEIIRIEHKEAVTLAMKMGLTAYDAAYLWLAGTAGAQFVTLDARLGANLT